MLLHPSPNSPRIDLKWLTTAVDHRGPFTRAFSVLIVNWRLSGWISNHHQKSLKHCSYIEVLGALLFSSYEQLILSSWANRNSDMHPHTGKETLITSAASRFQISQRIIFLWSLMQVFNHRIPQRLSNSIEDQLLLTFWGLRTKASLWWWCHRRATESRATWMTASKTRKKNRGGRKGQM